MGVYVWAIPTYIIESTDSMIYHYGDYNISITIYYVNSRRDGEGATTSKHLDLLHS